MTVKCWECGCNVQYIAPEYHNPYNLRIVEEAYKRESKIKRIRCKACESAWESVHKKEQKIYVELKAKLMLERAIRTLEKQIKNIYDYKESISVISEASKNNSEEFKSQEEMAAAIILIANRMQCKVNHKVGKYIVDFMLPELHCILEIDGHLHDYDENKQYDGKRDIELRKILGAEWEMVRIPAKFINTNVETLPKAIKAMIDFIKKTRSENNGILPEWFAARYQKYYKSILKS